MDSGEQQDTLQLNGVAVHMVRLIVQLTDARLFETPEWKMCVAGDMTGSLACFFYPSPLAKSKPFKRRARDSSATEDVIHEPQMVLVDDAKNVPLEPGFYYVLHGTPHLFSSPAGKPRTRACVSVVDAKRITSDFDQVTHHYLQCIQHHVARCGGRQPDSHQAGTSVVARQANHTTGGGGRQAGGAAADKDAEAFFSSDDANSDAASDML